MVPIKEVKSSNEALRTKHESLTAVFVGATKGIGLATLRAFATHVPKPNAIIVGRSRKQFETELENLRTINSNGTYRFFESDISLLKNVDAVCDQIKSQVSSSIDLLFVSQGYVGLGGRENNADGLDNSISLRYYGRVRFTQNLLPLMSKNGRAISVLAGGLEGKIFEDDLDLEHNYSVTNSAGHFAAMMTLAYDRMAEQNPEKSFIHPFPGLVNTGLLWRSAASAPWLLGLLIRYVVEPVANLFGTKPEDVGERMLYYATSEQFAGQGTKGCWTLDANGTVKMGKGLEEYRAKGMAEKVEEHNARIFERVTSA